MVPVASQYIDLRKCIVLWFLQINLRATIRLLYHDWTEVFSTSFSKFTRIDFDWFYCAWHNRQVLTCYLQGHYFKTYNQSLPAPLLMMKGISVHVYQVQRLNGMTGKYIGHVSYVYQMHLALMSKNVYKLHLGLMPKNVSF